MMSGFVESVGIDPRALRRAYSCFPSGVTAVCALVDGIPVGMAASSFTTVSLDPPLVSVCIQDTSTTWPVLATSPRIGVSILAAEHADACRRLASRAGDRFDGLSWEPTPDGAIVIRDAPAVMDCSIHDVLRAGDHDIVLLRVHGIRADDALEPLVFHASRFRPLAA